MMHLETDLMGLKAAELGESSRILQLLFHRNKNQHRRAVWWKWFSILRRCLAKLIIELKASDVSQNSPRLQYMRSQLVPRCYRSFSQLVQDSQFSALGLVLLAELARAGRVIGYETEKSKNSAESASTTARQSPISEEIGEAVERDVIDALPSTISPEYAENVSTKQGLDEKPSAPSSSRPPTNDADRTVKKAPLANSKAAKLKTRKRDNVIDELFRGL